MKNLMFTALVGLAMIGFTGCTTGSNAETAKCQAGKCQAGKCQGAKKCSTSTKCSADKAKCSTGKCGK